MMKGVKDAFPDWRPVVMEVVEYADGSCTVLTQQKIGAMKGDLPAMAPFPAVKLDSVPEAAKTTAAVLPVEVGTFTFSEDGAKLASGTVRRRHLGPPARRHHAVLRRAVEQEGRPVGRRLRCALLVARRHDRAAAGDGARRGQPARGGAQEGEQRRRAQGGARGGARAPEEGERWEALPLAAADCAAAVGKDAALKAKHFGAMPLAQVARQFRRLGKGDTFSWDVLYCTATAAAAAGPVQGVR